MAGDITYSSASINGDEGLVITPTTGDALSHAVNPNNKVYRQIFFVVMPVFWYGPTLRLLPPV